jgi:RND family efflux transporter MFP subunit
MKIWQTAIAIVVIGASTAGAIALMTGGDDDISTEQTKAEATTSVQTMLQSLASHSPEIRLLGKIEPQQKIDIVAELSAQVVAQRVNAGETVQEGDLLLSLDDFNAQLSVAQTQSDIADVETRIALLKSQQSLNEQAVLVERSQLALLKEKYKQQKAINASPQTLADLDQQIARQALSLLQTESAVSTAPLSLKQLTLQKDKLNLALSSAQKQLSKTRITAPFSGQVASINVHPGQTVNPGSPLLTLISNEQMLVKTSLPMQLSSVRSNLTGNATHQSKQSSVTFSHGETQLLPGSAGLSSWFDITDDQQWTSGEIINVSLNMPAIENALKVPVSALFQDKWIYTVDEEQRLAPIEVALKGRTREDNKDWLIVTPLEPLFTETRILTTRLNNPTSGLKIFERGVDPEPIIVDEGPIVETDESDAADNNNEDESDK